MSNATPSGWTQSPMTDVVELNPSQPSVVPPDKEEVTFLGMAAVEALSGHINTSEVRAWSDVKKGYKRFQEGDVLFAKITPCMENGKVAVAKGLLGLAGAGSTEFHVLRPMGVLLPQLLMYYLVQEDFRKAARSRMTGTAGQLRVPELFLEEQQLPIAPLPEQHRIVEAIESYLSRLDDAVANLERVQRNLKRYRASVLKAAVEGRLVPTEAILARQEGRSYEPASVLLERILEERRSRWKESGGRGKYKEPAAPDTSDLPELPEGWCWATVDQLAYKVSYGSSAKCETELDDGVPVLRMGNIIDGKLVFDSLKYLPPGHPELPDLLLQEGDLLFNRTNSPELVGKSAVYTLSAVSYSFASYLIRVRLCKGASPHFIVSFINSLAGRRWIASVVSQQVGQANVNGTKLKNCVVPLPPIEEQTRIVIELERLGSVMEASTQSVARDLGLCTRLRQAILKWAFEGKLVDQDPTDEPAAILLERIKAERAALTTGRRRRTR